MWCNISTCHNPNKVFEPFDLPLFNRLKESFFNLQDSEKSKYKGAEEYIEKNGGPTIKSLEKNYKLLVEETQKRLNSHVVPELYLIDHFSREESVQDLLSSFENEEFIKTEYKNKKLMVNKGLNTKESVNIIDCIRQGRILLQAGKKADMLAKPLIDFYAANAYAYAIIVLNSPLHKSIDTLKGSHGHTFDHKNKTIDFGGNLPSGTFIDLLCALPIVQLTNQNDYLKYSILPSIDFVQKNVIKFSLQALLSMVPEINDCYIRFDPEHKNIHPLNFDTHVSNNTIYYNFYIGNGVFKPKINNIQNCFQTDEINENQGSYKITVSAEKINSISPIIYRDIYGKLWYVESPVDGLYLPELCLHFLIISALCNIMRYSPHEWNNILTNKNSSQYSLLINQYIRLFEQKFPLLIIENMTNYLPTL